MKANITLTLAVAALVTLLASCHTSKSAVSSFSDATDSVKVEVSTKMGTGKVVLTSANGATVCAVGKAARVLPKAQTERLKSLANSLFIKRNEPIVLTEENVGGRTDHPIFTVTLYRHGKAEAQRYDMGDEDGGFTQCTHKRIRYSEPFREFMFSIFKVLQ